MFINFFLSFKMLRGLKILKNSLSKMRKTDLLVEYALTLNTTRGFLSAITLRGNISQTFSAIIVLFVERF